MKLDSPINDFYNEILNLIPPEVDKENLTIDVQDIVEKTLNETTPILLNSLRKQQGEMLEEHRLIRAEFEARLSRRWLKPLALFESLIVVSLESCEELYQELSEEMETNMKFKVLVRLHARACQISYEVLALVRSGFADGAMARWRTLHELSVLAFFISQNDTETAQMYLDYEIIEQYYEMQEYIKYAPKLGYSELTEEDALEIINKREGVIRKYGADFDKPFGWTMKVLNKKDRNFKGLEENIELDHLRPYYKLACNYIHLGPKASSFSLGIIEGSKVISAGATNYGLANPAQNACLSLTQITTCFLTLYPTYERLMTCKVMETFMEEACQFFVEIQEEIEFEEDHYLDELEFVRDENNY
ncbi:MULTISPECIES: DUF5677 domain-containing protein [Paenibacillus]|uniref:DUF5677 domain-containing protein n=1 Tax=Paenibacillus TaxID=44249 RepID=UPI00300879B9